MERTNEIMNELNDMANFKGFGESKEIIIDGVDVSECCFYHNGKCDNPNGMACNCINNAVCYFKELKRLEQENAELKAYKDVNEDFKTAWAELKAENDKLKKELGNNKATYEVALSTYNIECGNLLEENKQLWQTLQEIKAIVSGDYEMLDPQALQEIRSIITKAEEE